jgi:ABC-type transport system involved in multi-copper enzyme maturation permease subunit
MYGITGLLSKASLSAELKSGSALIFLTQPLSRVQYLLGKIAGLFLLSAGFLVVLSLIFYFSTRGRLDFSLMAILAGDAALALGLLFIIILVFWFSLFLPPLLAFAGAGLVYAVSLFHDFSYALPRFSPLTNPPSTASVADPTLLWDVFWPKLGSLQALVSSGLLGQKDMAYPGPISPPLQLGICILLGYAVLQWQFRKKDL